MTFHCPTCKHAYSEGGFCPFDGAQLAEGTAADQPTVISNTRPENEPNTALGIGTPGPAPESQVRAVSAASSESRADAMNTIRRRVSEYDALIGETLDGRYYVQRKIGEGGMGVVFAVKHTVIERPLAIKVLKRKVMRDEATVKRFIQEARAASRIGHPNIVDVTDFGTTDGMAYQVMELIDGTTLARVIKEESPLPFDRVIRIGSQIARALAAAHAKGIVHRDLKPENVFLIEREGRPDFVKIVDFGIAKVQPIEGTQEGPRLTRAGAVFGTAEYMAPEQAAGKSDTDHRVDIYALGTILYQMLVGKVPHKGTSMIQTVAMQMLDPITPPTQVNPELGVTAELEAVVMKALEKKRENRYQTMNELLEALETVEASLPARSALPAVPPGADAAPARPTPTPAGAPRRSKQNTRPLHEPEFVTPGAPVSFSHIIDESPPESERSSRWLMIFAGLAMLVLGAGGAILIAMKLQSREPVATTTAPGDAAVVTAELADAAVAEPEDARVIAELLPDAGTRISATARRDGGVTATTLPPRPAKGSLTIEVLTRPGDADVYVGHNYRGPSGVRITERAGTKLKIVCKTERMKGSVEVVFDGKRSAVMCTATRDRFCVPGLKNPYDDCEEDPNAVP